MHGGSVLLVEILRAAIEAVETISHHQADAVPGIERVLPARRRGGGAATAVGVEIEM